MMVGDDAGGPLRSIVVVGDGIAGLYAAVTLRRALPKANIRLVMMPDTTMGWLNHIGACGPNLHRFHRQIGLNNAVFARRTRAELVHLRRYRRADGAIAREACTPSVNFVEGVPLHHIWLRHCAEHGGKSPDFAALLLALQEAREEDGGFGVRFDAAAYRTLMMEMARALDVGIITGENISIDASDGRVHAITTDSGDTLSADLYVDAAGPQSRLLNACGVAWDDWSDTLPRLSFATDGVTFGSRGEESVTYDGGAILWTNGAWRTRMQFDATAAAPGRMTHTWCGNVVALGEAAMVVPLCDGTGFSHVIEDVLRMIALLPRPNAPALEQAEYNRRTEIAQNAMADWCSLNFADAEARRTEGLTLLWDAFAVRGRVAHQELDPIPIGAWLSRLMTLGPRPRRVDPTAWALPEPVVRSTIARAATAVPNSM